MAYQGHGGTLEIAALPTVGSLWLIPRLSSFYARYSDATVSVSARSTRFLFDETDFDGALGFGDAKWPGAQSDHLFDEELVPAANPRLFDADRLLVPGEVVKQRLLHLKSRPDAWQSWCETAMLSSVNFTRGPRFEVQSMLIGAACAGQGVALLPRFLIDVELRSDALRIVSDIAIRSEGAYYFYYPEKKADEPMLIRFREWLAHETRLFRQNARR